MALGQLATAWESPVAREKRVLSWQVVVTGSHCEKDCQSVSQTGLETGQLCPVSHHLLGKMCIPRQTGEWLHEAACDHWNWSQEKLQGAVATAKRWLWLLIAKQSQQGFQCSTLLATNFTHQQPVISRNTHRKVCKYIFFQSDQRLPAGYQLVPMPVGFHSFQLFSICVAYNFHIATYSRNCTDST